MPRLDGVILTNLADVLEQAARTCKQTRGHYDEATLKKALHSAQSLLRATLGMLEDEMMSLSQAALAFLASATRSLMLQSDVVLGMSELLEQINAYLGTEAISVFVLDPARDELIIQYITGPVSQDLLGLRVPVGQGVVGWVVKHQEDLIVPSTDLEPRFFSGVDEQTGFETQSILCVPIMCAGHILGAIEVLNKMNGNFNDSDVELMQGLASVVANYIAELPQDCE